MRRVISKKTSSMLPAEWPESLNLSRTYTIPNTKNITCASNEYLWPIPLAMFSRLLIMAPRPGAEEPRQSQAGIQPQVQSSRSEGGTMKWGGEKIALN